MRTEYGQVAQHTSPESGLIPPPFLTPGGDALIAWHAWIPSCVGVSQTAKYDNLGGAQQLQEFARTDRELVDWALKL